MSVNRRLCSVSGCSQIHYGRSYCRFHYQRLRFHGDALWEPLRLSIAERFWSKVDKSGDCWEWTAHRTPLGYGRFNTGDDFIEGAHRMAWRLSNGPIPAGTEICHHCDNPPCVNPEHLFLGSHADNMGDAARKKRLPGNRTRLTPGAKITPAMAQEIRALRGTAPYRVIGARYGIGASQVCQIMLGRQWRQAA